MEEEKVGVQKRGVLGHGKQGEDERYEERERERGADK